MDAYIKIWEFYDAPGELQDLSEHGGDEDWVMLVPAGRLPPPFITDSGHASYWFGCAGISEHDWKDGAKVYIGAHA